MHQNDQRKAVAALECRTVDIDGKSYQLRIEPSYWEALDDICRREEMTLGELCSDLRRRLAIHVQRLGQGSEAVSLANAVRVFAVGYYRQAATEKGHDLAGHGQGDPFLATPFENGKEPIRH